MALRERRGDYINNRIVIKGELPSLNQYIKAERGNRYSAARLKSESTYTCSFYTKAAINRGLKFTWPNKLKFTWYMKDQRKDPDNVAFAKKFILDGFMKCGLIANDNFKTITGFIDEFHVDKQHPRVVIEQIGVETHEH